MLDVARVIDSASRATHSTKRKKRNTHWYSSRCLRIFQVQSLIKHSIHIYLLKNPNFFFFLFRPASHIFAYYCVCRRYFRWKHSFRLCLRYTSKLSSPDKEIVFILTVLLLASRSSSPRCRRELLWLVSRARDQTRVVILYKYSQHSRMVWFFLFLLRRE